MRILLVEDEDDDARIQRRALSRRESWQVERVSTMSEAMDRVDEVDVDLAVIDHQLPDGDGLTLLKRLRARLPNLPVLFVTGAGNEDLALEAMRQGALDYFVKGPGLIDRLAQRAEEVLTGWPGDGPLVRVTTEADNDEGETQTRSPRGSTEVDRDAIENELDELVSGPIQGALVADGRGRIIAQQTTDEVETEDLARVASTIHDAIGRLRKIEDLNPRRYGVVVQTPGPLLALSAAPGPLIVGLLLRDTAGSMIGLRRAQEAARRIWEAA